jgi:hypothetical protein
MISQSLAAGLHIIISLWGIHIRGHQITIQYATTTLEKQKISGWMICRRMKGKWDNVVRSAFFPNSSKNSLSTAWSLMERKGRFSLSRSASTICASAY